MTTATIGMVMPLRVSSAMPDGNEHAMADTQHDTSDAPLTEPIEVSDLTRRRAVRASIVGTVVEYYEFTIYGFLAVVFGPLFFPSASDAAATLSALAVFGVGYLARPLGGIVFGSLGDRYGRRPVLMATLLIMGISSSLIGLLPTYASIGLAAPLLLLLLRLLQGFSAGGEWAGALTYVIEMAPQNKRALYGSFPSMGVGLGFASASLVVAVVAQTVGPDLATWGWRIPFFLCIPLTVLCVALRYRLEDSPEFRAIAASSEGVSRTPVRDTLRESWREVFRVGALTVGVLGPGILGKLYMAIYLIQERGIAPVQVFATLGLALVVSVWLFPLMGARSDRVGRRPIAWIGLSLLVVAPIPLFLYISSVGSIWSIAAALVIYLAIEPFVSAAVYTSYAEFFPARTRFTGISIGLNLGTIVAAGFGPAIASSLVASTGWAGAPGAWGSACAALGLVALAMTRETSRESLRR